MNCSKHLHWLPSAPRSSPSSLAQHTGALCQGSALPLQLPLCSLNSLQTLPYAAASLPWASPFPPPFTWLFPLHQVSEPPLHKASQTPDQPASCGPPQQSICQNSHSPILHLPQGREPHEGKNQALLISVHSASSNCASNLAALSKVSQN
jgi:hypothetical protein